MTYSTDDLTDVFNDPDEPQFVGFGQATLIEWDSATYANTVNYRGALLEGLSVLAHATGDIGSGDQILLMIWRPGGRKRSASYWIFGRVVNAPDLPPEVE